MTASLTHDELRFVAFTYQLLSRADGQVEAEEAAEIQAFLAARAPGAEASQLVAIVAEADAWYAEHPTPAERLERLEREAAALKWTMTTAERVELGMQLRRIGQADGVSEGGEKGALRAISVLIQRSITREVVRLLSFIYYTMAEADGAWTNEETLQLHEFLERESGSLTREQTIEIAREAYLQALAVEGSEARLQAIEERLPRAFGHMTAAERRQVLDNLVALAMNDDRLSKEESAVFGRIEALIGRSVAPKAAPSKSRPKVRPAQPLTAEELGLVAFMCQIVARADAGVEAAEVALVRGFLGEWAPGVDAPQIDAAIAAADAWCAAHPTLAERLERLDREAAGMRWSMTSAERVGLLSQLTDLARADATVAGWEEGAIRAVHDTIVRAIDRETYRLVAFMYYTLAEADEAWTNEETLLLHEFLEKQSGFLTREQSVELVRQAYLRALEVTGTDARLQEIEARIPRALGHLTAAERKDLIDNFFNLALSDDRVGKAESSAYVRLEKLVK